MSDKKHSPTGRRRTLLITWGITTALLVLTVLLVAKVALTAPPQPKELPKRLADVEVITVQPREYEETLVLPGRLEALSRKDIGSELAGRLETWLVSEGEAVEAGQEIARLNTDLLRAQRTTLETAREGAGIRAEAAETVLRTAEVALEQARTRLIAQRLQEEVAESALELAQSEFDRASALADEDIASRAELDAARHALNTALVGVRSAAEAVSEAQLAVDAAGNGVAEARFGWEATSAAVREMESALEELQVNLEKSALRSPTPGRLEEFLVEEGEVVSPGTAMATIFDLSRLRVRVDVPERYAPFLDPDNTTVTELVNLAMPGAERRIATRVVVPGMPKLTGGRREGIPLESRLVRVAQAADPVSNTFEVELRLDNPGQALREGIIVEAHLTFLAYAQAIVVPLQAIQVSDDGPRVLVVERKDGQDIALVRDIDPVSIKRDSVLVRGGIAGGDRLIVSGGRGVLHGEPVRVVVEDGVRRGNGASVDGGPVDVKGKDE